MDYLLSREINLAKVLITLGRSVPHIFLEPNMRIMGRFLTDVDYTAKFLSKHKLYR